ncbi:PLP-dependent aminotransferase family protein [Simiduia curdlanivorans]|uniref:PLP-dependent aminotransferase family protein n=1 Tax=Simiduia curdlanivorans TaxID=1492769 RepID=A0ABV8VAT5_9GAMM|nr:PLP-dependent aminotransferase family protein [Simiduia curdlanivorans]MDN3639334.1 PLP-dependent aminotransferase family protein [Simiduia curdlanivorans]
MHYKNIATTIIDDIEAGLLVHGCKLPSLRASASRHGVSLTTMINCYRYLEELGWLKAMPQRGYFVKQPMSANLVPHQPQFKGRAVKPKLDARYEPIEAQPKRLNSKPLPLSPFGTSQLAPSLLATENLQRSFKRSLNRLGDGLNFYPAVQGEPALRQALSQHFLQQGFAFHGDDLVITNGCLDAVNFAVDVTTRIGDTIAISSPCYSGLLDQLANKQRKVIEIPCTEEGIDLLQLEQLCREKKIQAGLFSTTHMNPQGISMTPSQKQKLVALAEKYRVPMIEDDVFLELGTEKSCPLPAKHWDKNGWILWCGSVSKTLGAGLRVGWCLPGKHLEDYVNQQKTTHIGVNKPVQLAVSDFIQTGQYLAHLQRLRLRLLQQLASYRDIISQELGDAVAISQPKGGTVIWLESAALQQPSLVTKLEQKFDIRPGRAFSTLAHYDSCIRINAGWPLDECLSDKTSVRQHLIALCREIKKAR